jgi:hypothetical protein
LICGFLVRWIAIVQGYYRTSDSYAIFSSGQSGAFLLRVRLLDPACADARGIDPNKPLTEYTHTVWIHKDGIPSAFIYAIAQTRDGPLALTILIAAEQPQRSQFKQGKQ